MPRRAFSCHSGSLSCQASTGLRQHRAFSAAGQRSLFPWCIRKVRNSASPTPGGTGLRPHSAKTLLKACFPSWLVEKGDPELGWCKPLRLIRVLVCALLCVSNLLLPEPHRCREPTRHPSRWAGLVQRGAPGLCLSSALFHVEQLACLPCLPSSASLRLGICFAINGL